MVTASLTTAERAALTSLAQDLRDVFGNRLRAVCAYGITADERADLRSIALVDRLSFDDFVACIPLASSWDARGLATPLILDRDEFTRTLDVFPLEYGEIIANHTLVFGDDPFEGISVTEGDRRRACELQAKSHLIHLREGFLETRGENRAVTALIGASAEGYRRLLFNIVALVAPADDATVLEQLPELAERHLGVSAALTREVIAAGNGEASTIVDPTSLLARYVTGVERLWEFVDGWQRC